MPKPKNIALTGSPGSGKSTLANWLLEQLQLPWDGFRTLRYDLTPLGPLYEMAELSTGCRAPISALTEEGIRGIPRTFDTFGAALLEKTCQPVLLLDEIGRFERSSQVFLDAVFAALDSSRTVIVVLKKEPLPHIRQIRQREDTLLIDLDETGGEEARALLRRWFG